MLRQLISTLLIAGIFACPFCCAGDVTGTDHGKAAGCGCCHSHRGVPASDCGSVPGNQPPRGADEPCGCICGGALIEVAAAQDFGGVDITLWVPAADLSGKITRALTLDVTPSSVAPWPDDGMNVGRALRCLYSTFLC